MAARISLPSGEFVIVDDADVHWLAKIKWHRHPCGYAQGWMAGKKILMHRLILGIVEKPRSVMADHINGNKLDNRRSNLRTCSMQQNQQHRFRAVSNSGYKGVHFHKATGRYQCYIKSPTRRNISLGYWPNAEDAARAYDRAAVLLFGKFAQTNFTH